MEMAYKMETAGLILFQCEVHTSAILSSDQWLKQIPASKEIIGTEGSVPMSCETAWFTTREQLT